MIQQLFIWCHNMSMKSLQRHCTPSTVCTMHEMMLQQLSARNYILAAVLKLWGLIKNQTVSRSIFTRGTVTPNFIPIGFETTEP